MYKKVDYNFYASCHQKIIRKFGKASKCENAHCISLAPKRFEWALKKDKEYSSDIRDYIQLCPSCHRKYDLKKEQGAAHSIRMKGKKPTKKQSEALDMGRKLSQKTILQLSKEGQIIKEWPSLTEVFQCTGILQSSISNCLNNKSKTAGGYKWKLKN